LDRNCNIKPKFPAEIQPLLTNKKVSAMANMAIDGLKPNYFVSEDLNG
jgi:hypothetical protein